MTTAAAIKQMSPTFRNPYRPSVDGASVPKGSTATVQLHSNSTDVILAHAMLQEETFQRMESKWHAELGGEMIAEITNKPMQEQRAEYEALQRRLGRFSVTVRVFNGKECNAIIVPASSNDTSFTLGMRVGLELMRDVTGGRLESAGSIIDGELTLRDAGVDEGATLQLFEEDAAPFAEMKDEDLTQAFLEALKWA